MAFKILIVEDEELYADKLEMLIDKLEYEHFGTVDNSKDALALLEKGLPDLILMDVHIHGEHDGIELTDLIHQKHLIPVVFITSLQDELTYNRASRTKPVNFLAKPFNEIQLQRTIELTVKNLQKEEEKNSVKSGKEENWENDFLFEDHFFIKTRQKLEKVAVHDVLYLEQDGRYCQVHTDSKKFLVRMPMSEMIKRLPPQLFIQTHRSFFVNYKKVSSVDLQDSIVLLNEKHVPLSKRNKEELLSKLDWI